MTAITPVSSLWIAEDDLLLKNSIEAGASLEALAKGAVKFSRRFTIRELRDRWYALLYDSDVSTQASACMVELEVSVSNPSSKHSRSDNLKGSEKVPEKRKMGSIRKQYYAMRKRLKNEFFSAAGLGFFEEPTLRNCSRHEHNFQDHVTLNHEAHGGNAMLGDCLANNLGLEETDFEILRQAFPETIGDIAATTGVDNATDAFPTGGCHNSVANNYINGSGTGREDGLYEFTEDVSPLIRNGLVGTFDPNVEPKSATVLHKGDSDNFVKCMSINEVGPPPILPSGKLLKAEESQANLALAYDSVNESNQILCSGFGGKQHFNSPGSDGSASFHTMGFSSRLPRLPLWRTMEDVSVPDMPVDENNAENNQVVDETLALPDNGDHRIQGSPRYDDIQSVSFLGDRPDNADFINSRAAPEGEYTDLPDSLLNFSNEDDVLYMDVDGKEMLDDNPNSQFLGSPEDAPEGGWCSAEVTRALVASSSLATRSDHCHEESKDISSSFHGDQQTMCVKVEVPSTSSLAHPDSLHLTEGKIVCTLNTEDTEIPCNDDIFLLIHPSTSFAPLVRQQVAMDSIDPLSSSADEKDGEQGLKDPAPPFARALMVGPNVIPESASLHPPVSCTFKSQLPYNKPVTPLPRQLDKQRNPIQSRSMHAAPIIVGDGVLEKDVCKVELRGLDTSATCSEMPFHSEDCSVKVIDREAMDNPSISDQSDSKSDGDIPYFSDIEAMILEMDLGYAQDSCISSEVARYQYESTKKTIIRLEQTARSSLQRAMSYQGALAIFYGRHLKHYVKKTEVTIGRSTDDTDVDIDLRKEGRANKISRRQGTIKMETDGSFSLKNLGKGSISVNGKAIASGQVVALSSSSLIEIRGMSFMFEINNKYVRRYMDNVIRKSQGTNRTFKWSPEGKP